MGMEAQRHISTLSCASQLGHQTCLQTWSRVHHVAQAADLHHAGPTCQLSVGSEPRPEVHKQHFVRKHTLSGSTFPLTVAASLFADGLCCQVPAEQRSGQA